MSDLHILDESEFIPDETFDECQGCHEEFSFFIRKHHCRLCGSIFCDDCSSCRIEISNKKIDENIENLNIFDTIFNINNNIRVCYECFDWFLKQEETKNEIKKKENEILLKLNEEKKLNLIKKKEKENILRRKIMGSGERGGEVTTNDIIEYKEHIENNYNNMNNEIDQIDDNDEYYNENNIDNNDEYNDIINNNNNEYDSEDEWNEKMKRDLLELREKEKEIYHDYEEYKYYKRRNSHMKKKRNSLRMKAKKINTNIGFSNN